MPAKSTALNGLLSVQTLVGIIFASGFSYMVWLLINSPGTHSHDEIGHYLISRDAWRYPELIFNTWGRTVHTLIYMIPAAFGLLETRFWSIILSVATVFLTLDVAKKLTLPYWYLTPVFLLFQPWFAELSFLNITQVPFSLLMVSVVWLGLKNRYLFASLLAGMLPMVRHEGLALLALWTIFLIYQKNWRALLTGFVPYAMYNITSFWYIGTYPLAIFFQPTPNEIYGSGAIYHYLIRLPHPQAVGIPLAMLSFLGLKQIFQSPKHILIACWYGSYFMLHTIIYSLGLFASGGYKFFLLPLAPAFACLCVMGLKEIDIYLQCHLYAMLNRVTQPMIIAICIGWTLYFTSPHKLSDIDIAVEDATVWIQNHVQADKLIYSNHVYFYHYMPADIDPRNLWEEIPKLSNQPHGTIVMWDTLYSPMWGLKLNELQSDESWAKKKSFGSGAVHLFEKQ